MSSLKLKHSGGNSVSIAGPSSNPAANRTINLNDNYAGDGSFVTANSSGNVGISTASPVAQTTSGGTALTPVLDLKGTGSINNASGVLQFTRKDNSVQGSCIYSCGDEAGLTFRNTDSNGFGFYNGTTQALRIKSTGKVGINTSNPGAKFTVDENNASEHFQLRNTTNTSNFSAFGVDTSFNLRFYVNGANERMRINSSGRVCIGTTNDDGGGSANTDNGVVLKEDGQVICRRDDVMYTAKSLGTGGYTAFRTMSAQTQVGSITFNSGGTSFNTSSDYRRKENIVNLTDGITRLKTLKPYKFNFKDEPKVTRDGFLAHEVTAVPEAIWGTKDAVQSEDGEDHKKGDPIYQQLDQSKLVPLLTAALQEAITKIETLETKVAALEAG